VWIVRDIHEDLPPLRTDRDKLNQILFNLLSNAAKFAEQGEIRVSAARENAKLKLAVADSSIGMTPLPLEAYIRRISASREDHRKQVRGHRPRISQCKKIRKSSGRRNCGRERKRQRVEVYDHLANGT
jgi:K+-sensing histidine kinase KdpD